MPPPLNQAELVARLCERPPSFAWFLGTGASRAAGLPTATDLIWDLKWRHYCRHENQDIDRRDLQNGAVRARVQAYFDARGFPSVWDDDEYAVYFERIFGSDRERQRNYIAAHLAEERVSLSVGNRAFGALLAARLVRVAFTTNFDNVVEKAVAEVGSSPLPVYHLEGARAANTALDNEDFPLYCKLHGDFRYDSLKNLTTDLRNQNKELSSCLVNTANRFGFVVSGYSGRDESVMRLFHRVLDSPNPFPHGLYWTVMNGSDVPAPVRHLVDAALSKGVLAAVVEIQTFDAFMLHLWRNIENKPVALDAKVRKSRLATVDIPLPSPTPKSPVAGGFPATTFAPLEAAIVSASRVNAAHWTPAPVPCWISAMRTSNAKTSAAQIVRQTSVFRPSVALAIMLHIVSFRPTSIPSIAQYGVHHVPPRA